MKPNMSISELVRLLDRSAEEKFGRDRAEELRVDTQQLAADLLKLYTVSLDIEDEP